MKFPVIDQLLLMGYKTVSFGICYYEDELNAEYDFVYANKSPFTPDEFPEEDSYSDIQNLDNSEKMQFLSFLFDSASNLFDDNGKFVFDLVEKKCFRVADYYKSTPETYVDVLDVVSYFDFDGEKWDMHLKFFGIDDEHAPYTIKHHYDYGDRNYTSTRETGAKLNEIVRTAFRDWQSLQSSPLIDSISVYDKENHIVFTIDQSGIDYPNAAPFYLITLDDNAEPLETSEQPDYMTAYMAGMNTKYNFEIRAAGNNTNTFFYNNKVNTHKKPTNKVPSDLVEIEVNHQLIDSLKKLLAQESLKLIVDKYFVGKPDVIHVVNALYYNDEGSYDSYVSSLQVFGETEKLPINFSNYQSGYYRELIEDFTKTYRQKYGENTPIDTVNYENEFIDSYPNVYDDIRSNLYSEVVYPELLDSEINYSDLTAIDFSFYVHPSIKEKISG